MTVQLPSDERPPCMCGHVASTHDMGYGLATCIGGDCDCEWYVADEREESAEQLPMTDTSDIVSRSSNPMVVVSAAEYEQAREAFADRFNHPPLTDAEDHWTLGYAWSLAQRRPGETSPTSNEHTTISADWEKAKAAMSGERLIVNTNNPIDRLLAELDEDASDCKRAATSLPGRAAETIRLLVKALSGTPETGCGAIEDRLAPSARLSYLHAKKHPRVNGDAYVLACQIDELLGSSPAQTGTSGKVHMDLLRMIRRQLHIGHTSYALEAINYLIDGKEPPPCAPCEIAEMTAAKASEQHPRSLVEEAHTLGRQRPSKSHDAGSNPVGDTNAPDLCSGGFSEQQCVDNNCPCEQRDTLNGAGG